MNKTLNFWDWLVASKVTPEDIGVFIIALIVVMAMAVAAMKER